MPGVLVMTAFFSSGWNGMPTIDDINRGVVDRLLVTPVRRMPLIGGRVLQNLVQVVIQSLVIVALALAIGVSFHGGVLGVAVLVLAAGLLGTGFAALSNALALLTRQEESLIGAVTFLQLPLTFLSTAFMQPELMPGWINTVAQYNPVDWAIRAGREAVAASTDWARGRRLLRPARGVRARLPAAGHARLPCLPGAGVGVPGGSGSKPDSCSRFEPLAGAGRAARRNRAGRSERPLWIIVAEQPNPRRTPPASGRLRDAEEAIGGWIVRLIEKTAFLLFGAAVYVSCGRPSRSCRWPAQVGVLALVYAPLGLLIYRLSKMPDETLAPFRRHGLAQPFMFVTGLWLAAIGWFASLAFVLVQRGVVDFHAAGSTADPETGRLGRLLRLAELRADPRAGGQRHAAMGRAAAVRRRRGRGRDGLQGPDPDAARAGACSPPGAIAGPPGSRPWRPRRRRSAAASGPRMIPTRS